MEKLRQQAEIEQEKFDRETQRLKTECEQQMNQVVAKRQDDSDTLQRDIEVRRVEPQRVLDYQRL